MYIGFGGKRLREVGLLPPVGSEKVGDYVHFNHFFTVIFPTLM